MFGIVYQNVVLVGLLLGMKRNGKKRKKERKERKKTERKKRNMFINQEIVKFMNQ